MPRMSATTRVLKKRIPDMVDPEQPWRYNPELDEDSRYDIFYSIEPYSLDLEMEKYWPDKKELEKEGGWVWILRPPHTTVNLEFGGLYFAKPYHDGVKGFRNKQYSVTVYAPDGEVRLFPHEYAHPAIEEMIEFLSEGAFKFHVNEEELAQQELTDRLFYIQARGIPLVEALPMALGDIKRPVGWFEMITP